jgi:hypothetical protein
MIATPVISRGGASVAFFVKQMTGKTPFSANLLVRQFHAQTGGWAVTKHFEADIDETR